MDIKYEGFELEIVDPCSCLFACISGAHSFGWVTPKSDLDVRFVIFTPIGQLISPFFKHHTQARMENNIDITEYPIDHYLQLLAKGNGNAVDNLFEPKLTEQKEAVQSLQEIVKANIHKGFIGHCLGYSLHIKKDFDIPSRLEKYGIEKLLLCRYRVLLQGMNLFQGQIEHNLPKLLKNWPTLHAQTILIAYTNSVPVAPEILDAAIEETDRLHVGLSEALNKSSLPSFHQSNIVVCLDRWIKQQYLGDKKQGAFNYT